MNSSSLDTTQIELLLEATDPSLRAELYTYIIELLENDHETKFGIDGEFIGFIDDYYHYGKIIENHSVEKRDEPKGRVRPMNLEVVVYDIGCATALQHVFFGDRKYVGIDMHPFEPKFFTSNSEYIQGDFLDLDLEVEANAIGIANMSLLYSNTLALQKFNNTFARKFVL